MSKVNSLQLFINRYYTVIRLILFLVIIGLLLSLFVNRLEVVDSIKPENAKQTETIKDQFQALCVLIVTTSPESTLSQLSPANEAKCRKLLNGKQFNRQAKDNSNQPVNRGLFISLIIPTSSQNPVRPPQKQPDKPSQPSTSPQPTNPPPQNDSPDESRPVNNPKNKNPWINHSHQGLYLLLLI